MEEPSDNEIQELAASLREAINLGSPSELIDSLTQIIAKQQLEISALAEDVDWLTTALKARDIIVSSPEFADIIAGVSEIDIFADMPLPGDRGFYDLEYDATGNAYRWTGPSSEFSFMLQLDRSKDLELSLDCLHAVDPANEDGITCTVNRKPVALRRIENPEKGFGFEGAIPLADREIDRTSATTIAFHVPVMICPAEDRGEADGRTLGVCFSQLSIRPASS